MRVGHSGSISSCIASTASARFSRANDGRRLAVVRSTIPRLPGLEFAHALLLHSAVVTVTGGGVMNRRRIAVRAGAALASLAIVGMSLASTPAQASQVPSFSHVFVI